MDNQNYDARASSSRRLVFSKEDFDDYLLALTAKLRSNTDADRLLSGETQHPLVNYQYVNRNFLMALGMPFFSAEALIDDPVSPYIRFLRQITTALLMHPPPVPVPGDLNALQALQDSHRAAERHIYSTIVSTLQVGRSMHYARQCVFGAGQRLLEIIIAENRQVTTRSLMAIFSALLSLALKDGESFDLFARRIDLLIQRLRSWRPPVFLPEQLLLFCALRALPAVPFGPVRHIILATPRMTFSTGMGMLRDVANTGGALITSTLGSGSAVSKAANVLCAPVCPPAAPHSQPTRARAPRNPEPNSNLYLTLGPCKHHGPTSKHATCECKDPTLSRRKKRKPRGDSRTIAAVAAAVPAPTGPMFSPVFVTRISRSASNFPRASFQPARRHRKHLRHNFHPRRSSQFSVNRVSREVCDDCIRTYSSPIAGNGIPAAGPDASVPRPNRRRKHTRSRRTRRRRSNRRANYPAGRFQPSRPRVSRPVRPYVRADALSRRARRRNLVRETEDARLLELLRRASVLPSCNGPVPPVSKPPASAPPCYFRVGRSNRKARCRRQPVCKVHPPKSSHASSAVQRIVQQFSGPYHVDANGCDDDDVYARVDHSGEVGACADTDPAGNPVPESVSVAPPSPPVVPPLPPPVTVTPVMGPQGRPNVGQGYTFVGAVNLHLGIAVEHHLEPDAPYSYITSAALGVPSQSLARGHDDPLPPHCPGLHDILLQWLGHSMCSKLHYAYVDLHVVHTVLGLQRSRLLLANTRLRVLRSDVAALVLGRPDIRRCRSAPCTHLPAVVPDSPEPSPPVTFCFVTTVRTPSERPQGHSNSSTASSDGSPSSPAVASVANTSVVPSLSLPPPAAPVVGPATTAPAVVAPVPVTSPSPPVVAPPLPPPLPSMVPSLARAPPTAAAASASTSTTTGLSAVGPDHSHYPFYAVGRGIVPWVYEDWQSCKANVHGVPNSKYKGFYDRQRAAEFVSTHYKVLKRPAPSVASHGRSKSRRFRGNSWSKKGSKATRRLARSSSSASVQPPTPAPALRASTPPTVSAPAPAASASLPPAISATISNVTEDPLFADARPARLLPTLRRAKARYAFAEGLHTTLEYPQQFLVRLTGDPAALAESSSASVTITGSPAARAAVTAVINANGDCPHPNCPFKLGNYLTRRARHVASLRRLDALYAPNVDALVTSASSPIGDILDSGAARHVESSRSRFRSLRPCDPVTLVGIRGNPCVITHQGSVGGFSNVLFAPDAQASVRSVSALVDVHSSHIVFSANSAYLVAASPLPASAVKLATRREDGLYHIVANSVPTRSVRALLSVPQQIKRERVHQLHRTLAHASPRRMREVLTRHPSVCRSLLPKDVQLFTSCPACAIGNAKKSRRPRVATTRATAFGFRLHMDTSGTVRPSTPSGFSRTLIVVDDASRWIFVSLLRHASMRPVCLAIRAVLRLVSTTHSVLRTKIIRCDNGTEFRNQLVDALLVEAGIHREFTCVGTSHQNGVAESAIGTIFAIARTMLVDAKLSPKFWGEAVLAATHVHNRMPCAANNAMASPYEIRFGNPPDLSHLRPFGISAFVNIKEHVTKVMPRALRGILLGYGHAVSHQKGWRVLVPTLGKVVTTTDATFGSNLAEAVTSRSPGFTSNTSPVIDDVDTTTAEPSAITGLPNSLSPATPSRPVTRSMTSRRGSPQTLSAPAAAGLGPTPAATPPSAPAAASPSAPTPAPASRAVPAGVPHITEPVHVSDQIDPAVPVASSRRRPPGRPPRNSRWDANSGQYLPVLTAARLPTQARIWALVTRKVTDDPRCPTSVADALNGPDAVHWRKAIDAELASMAECKVWRVIKTRDMPAGATTIKTKWVFKIKRDSLGRITRYKARLTACGYGQKYGRDFDETFAPVASATSIRTAFALAATRGFTISQHDIQTAFLYGTLPEHQRVYLRCPDAVEIAADECLQCIMGIYGLRQSPRLFNEHLDKVLSKLGYKQSQSDPCLYFRRANDEFSLLAVVVDDILHVCSSEAVAARFVQQMESTYRMKHLGVPALMVGIRISVSPATIRLDQRHYIAHLVASFKQTDCAPVAVPASTHGCLAAGACPDSPLLDKERFPYLSLVGSLLWVTITRPDVAAVVSRACQHSRAPTMAHWRAAIRILRYLHSTADLALCYDRTVRPVVVSAYADAAFGNETERRSRYGHAVYLADCLVCWQTKATKSVCLSTAEAEYIAATECTKDIVWLRNLLAELGFPQSAPTVLYEDNQACVAMVNNHVVTGRNRHFCVKMAWLRAQKRNGIVFFVFVASKNNVADIFTKILAVAIHQRLSVALLRDMDTKPRGGC